LAVSIGLIIAPFVESIELLSASIVSVMFIAAVSFNSTGSCLSPPHDSRQNVIAYTNIIRFIHPFGLIMIFIKNLCQADPDK
jgi:hypothetical protein